MRRAARVDNNQATIVAILRKLGFTVTLLHQVGSGVPDLVAGKYALNFLVEVKKIGGKLTPDQVEWHDEWRGSVHIIETEDDCIRLSDKAWKMSVKLEQN